MGKITFNCKNNVFVMLNKLSRKEDVNAREFDIISRGEIASFLPICENSEKKGQLKCDIVGCMTLDDFLKNPMDKKTFVKMLSQILNVLKSCEERAMHTKNIEFDFKYVFVDIKTQNLKFIYWPVVNVQSEEDILSFLKKLAYTVVFVKTGNVDYVYEYISFVENANPFSIKSLEKFIERHVTQENSHFFQNEDENQSKRDIKNISYMPNYNAKRKNDSSKVLKNATDSTNQIFYNIKDCTNNFEDEDTVYLGIGNKKSKKTYIIVCKTNEKIAVDKPVFKIGSKQGLVDYVVNDNKTVSRHHASIFVMDNKNYIMDNDSTNGTFIDGIALQAKQETEIPSGTKFRLSNEDFIFVVE